MIKSRLLFPLAAATVSLGLALAPAAFAQGMKKDNMEKSSMSKDGMKKDGMKKDTMGKKDNMKK
jgi:pentapeptide MXKDX repeat protein